MADTKVSALAALTGANLAAADLFPFVDVSDTSMAASGTDKSVRFDELSGLWLPKSLFTAAGDVPIGTGNGTATNLAPGTVGGKALVADPNATNKASFQYPLGVELASRGTTGSFASTYDRALAPGFVGRTVTGGRIELVRILLPKGATVTNIAFWANTSGASMTHQWFGLFDNALAKLGVTSDDTSTAWTLSTKKSLALASPFVTTYAGLYYIGYCITATVTVPNIGSYATTLETTVLRAAAPASAFAGDSSLTTPASCPNTITSAGVIGNMMYGEVS